MYFAVFIFFINGVLNNQSYICNNKEELIGLLKSWRLKQAEMSKIKWEWLYCVKHSKNYQNQTVEEP